MSSLLRFRRDWPRRGNRLEANAVVAGIRLTVVVLVPADLRGNPVGEGKAPHELSGFRGKEVSAIDTLRNHVHSEGPLSFWYNDVTFAG